MEGEDGTLRGIEELKRLINNATVISFDVFDTLLFRKVNEPETIFELVGKHFGIHGFRKLRVDEQNEASRRVYAKYQYPHADMNEIYEVLAEHTEIPVDWNEVKAYEIQMEKDALVANKEMLDIFLYAKSLGKRIVITSDMYLLAETLSEILEQKGFCGFDYVYCSADEHKAKFNKELFEQLAKKENVPYEEILHIGDKERDDGEYPKSFGMKTFIYRREVDLDKIKNVVSSDIDKGLYKILFQEERSFWYNLGVEVGGPLYMALFPWLLRKTKESGKKIFFLSRDGYNLYHIFKEYGYENIEYLYTSRRALTLASIVEMNESDIEILPPYTKGQSVGEILDYLCIERGRIQHLNEAGFSDFKQIIATDEDMAAFKKLYVYDKDVFLERCRKEREAALSYFEKIGFTSADSIVFDCGWQGSSQDLIERFKKAVNCNCENFFYYFGIRNTEKSRKQLHGLPYETFLFDFYKNYELQAEINQATVIYELFFSAPHQSVYYYNDGDIIFENGDEDSAKSEILQGILDYIKEGLVFAEKYNIEYSPEISVGHLQRFIQFPTENEAVTVGNIRNVDGFARKAGEEKYIAYITQDQLEKGSEIYWLRGLLKRPDISEKLKTACAARCGMQYPEEISEYHLEDAQSIRNYHRWLRYQENHVKEKESLSYQPKFSIVIPVYNTVTEQLRACIDSVLGQTYDNFELILVDDHSSWDNVVPVLQSYEADHRVRVIYRATNGHISVATNDGIFMSNGDFIVFMDCDDVIDPDALYEIAKKLNENPMLDFIYTDEDKITEDGKIRHMPFFKPDWSPDLFLCMNYTNHLSTYRAEIVKEIGGLRSAYNGSQDYDFMLRFMEKSDNTRVGHIAKILYHWRERKESVAFAMDSKNYAAEAARYAKEDYIRRNKISAHLEYISGISQYRIVYEVLGNPKVSIIIPSKDHPEVLKQCIDSIQRFTFYENYEIIVVDNGSRDENKRNIEQYLAANNARYLYGNYDFNFSYMCNFGARQAQGEYLLFLNDDIEIIQLDWIERMLGHAQQKHTGAVGAKLFYPYTTTIQHTGVLNLPSGPEHSFLALDDEMLHYFGWNRVDSNYIAVTGACLMVQKEKYNQINGFDEDLPVAYNDVKLCVALHKCGYYNVIRNDVVAYHHESLSRGNDHVDDKKLIRLSREMVALYSEFPDLKERDPYFNPNLKKWSLGLEMRVYFDELRSCDLVDIQEGGNANIDFINVTDRIQILGWSFLGDQEEKARYLVFRDPYGKMYMATALSVYRPDVAECFGDGVRYQYAGFECILRKLDLRIDLMSYNVGVLTIDKENRKYIRWCRKTDIIRNQKPRLVIKNSKQLSSFEKQEGSTNVQWYIDENSYNECYHKIRGYAYCRGDHHYQYTKSIILYDNQRMAYEFEVYEEERIDVAYTFPNEHFLYYTGFICYIFDGVLEQGRDYDVIIRLRNQFDKEDIRDVVTGEKISM